jgi:putative DNA primase/helicase
VTKQRDLSSKGDRIGFQLEPMVMGYNKWGAARSTCVAVSADAPAKRFKGKRHSEIAPQILAVLDANPSGCSRSHLVGVLEGKAARQSIYREVANLLKGGKLSERAGLVQHATRQVE